MPPRLPLAESSGKTTLALHAMAEVQKAGGAVALIDAEHAFDPVFAKVGVARLGGVGGRMGSLRVHLLGKGDAPTWRLLSPTVAKHDVQSYPRSGQNAAAADHGRMFAADSMRSRCPRVPCDGRMVC